MAEQDPREYRGGVHEPDEAKGGSESWADNEGVVPREMVDDPPEEKQTSDGQALDEPVLGAVTDRPAGDDAIDRSGGDAADATQGTTGANNDEVKEEVAEGEPVSWVEGANAAAADGATPD